ncbi:hypothetical protein ARMSODRAFT_974324 [Armillaria solidipes]|uniref:Uncharacterized protein n=1 Tax=Armillaria solidipes TaxID=1076256 RepID=A0A2H3C2J7_9AGAR|nr:hypothetical protein ARMSODRAFT_974324 [Armillaria solidipes]
MLGCRKDIWQYAKAFLLSSAAVCYVGDCAYHVMPTLCEMKTKCLPAEVDIPVNTALLSKSPTALQRNALKLRLTVKRRMQSEQQENSYSMTTYLTHQDMTHYDAHETPNQHPTLKISPGNRQPWSQDRANTNGAA